MADSLFDRLPARRTDPVTSREAARAVTDSGDRERQIGNAAALVAANPGMTSLDLAAATGADRYMLARRLPEAEAAGLVRRGEPIRSASGRRGVTWWPVDR